MFGSLARSKLKKKISWQKNLFKQNKTENVNYVLQRRLLFLTLLLSDRLHLSHLFVGHPLGIVAVLVFHGFGAEL